MAESTLIKTFDVPDIPKALFKLLEEVSKEDCDYALVERYVKNMPILNLRLFKIINSPLYSFNSKIKNIRQAIGLLGLKDFKFLILSILVFDVMNNLRKFKTSAKLENIWKRLAVSSSALKCFTKNTNLFFISIYIDILEYLILYNNEDIDLNEISYNEYINALTILAQKWKLSNEITNEIIKYYQLRFNRLKESNKTTNLIYSSKVVANLLLLNGLSVTEVDFLKLKVKLTQENLIKLVELIKIKLKEISELFSLDEELYSDSFLDAFIKANIQLKRLNEEKNRIKCKLKENVDLLTNTSKSYLCVVNDKLVVLEYSQNIKNLFKDEEIKHKKLNKLFNFTKKSTEVLLKYINDIYIGYLDNVELNLKSFDKNNNLLNYKVAISKYNKQDTKFYIVLQDITDIEESKTLLDYLKRNREELIDMQKNVSQISEPLTVSTAILDKIQSTKKVSFKDINKLLLANNKLVSILDNVRKTIHN